MTLLVDILSLLVFSIDNWNRIGQVSIRRRKGSDPQMRWKQIFGGNSYQQRGANYTPDRVPTKKLVCRKNTRVAERRRLWVASDSIGI